jgi:bacterioferritin-associated ferredoxin
MRRPGQLTVILNCITNRDVISVEAAAMYVCICHGFTEKKVKQALSSGARTAAGVFNGLGCRPQCGKCVPYVRQMVSEHACNDSCSQACFAAAE